MKHLVFVKNFCKEKFEQKGEGKDDGKEICGVRRNLYPWGK